MNNIVLIGMPGCGKSTAGVILAKTLGMDFVDTDLIVQQRENRLLQDIIDLDGLENFLDRESEAILSREYSKSVISTGGSAVFRQNTMEHLKKNSAVIFLDVSPDILGARINNIKTRGIAAGKNEKITDIYNSRLPLYRKYADHILNCDGESVEKTVEKIIELLKNEKI